MSTQSLDTSRLQGYLEEHIEGFSGELTAEKFAGGQSNPTYQLITPARNYVLRRKPPGELLPSAHAVDREFRMISALHKTGFPVPRPYLLCEDLAVTGTRAWAAFSLDVPVADDLDTNASGANVRRALERAYEVAWALRGPAEPGLRRRRFASFAGRDRWAAEGVANPCSQCNRHRLSRRPASSRRR